VLNPTNGSSFSGTLVQTQQVASSRMRAIETGRWLLQVAPTGFSAVIAPDGTVEQRTAVSERRVLHATVGIREGTTLYTRWGLAPALAVALAGLAAGWAVEARSGRRRDPAAVAPTAAAATAAAPSGDEPDEPEPEGAGRAQISPLSATD
jgi:apolipoprotein N-acyltransferase